MYESVVMDIDVAALFTIKVMHNEANRLKQVSMRFKIGRAHV